MSSKTPETDLNFPFSDEMKLVLKKPSNLIRPQRTRHDFEYLRHKWLDESRSSKSFMDDIYDLDNRMDDHSLPLELFCKHVNHYLLSSADEELVFDLLEQCHGDSVEVVLLAKELRKVHDGSDLKEVLDELKSYPSSHIENGVSVPRKRALTFIWRRKDATTKLCIHSLATHISNGEELEITSMVSSWLTDGLVQTEREGVKLISGLTKSGFLVKEGLNRITMPNEVKDVLLRYVIPSLGLPSTARAIVEDAEIINLKNSEVADLPDSPNCPRLLLLCLHSNCDLMMIPPLLFKNMPLLSTLNVSHTSIKTLPASISALVSLRRLLLRGCDLFLELPPEIGKLSELEEIDLEGTRVMYLPDEIARLQKLRSLKLSFYACGKGHQGSKRRVPEGVLSNLYKLKDLWIGVKLDEDDDDQWVADLKNLLLNLPNTPSYINHRTSIRLYVPDASLLKLFSSKWAHDYKLIVGRCGQRMISRIPSEVEEKSKQHARVLKYVNGECIQTEIKEVLKYCHAFILDRHWTVKSLSEFLMGKGLTLKFCVLVECNEMQTILDKDDEYLLIVSCLHVYYMKNLRSICSGQTTGSALDCLRYLSLCRCASLYSIFPLRLLHSFWQLQEIILEDCPKIESLVTQDCAWVHHERYFLPGLKKMSLLELPELVSISNGLKMAPKLEKLVIFYCPKLQSISEVIGGNLKVIKGETEWWDSLSWKETDTLASIFVPLKRDGDLMAQFTED